MDVEIGNGAARLMLGDCLERLRGLPDASVDSIVTDPPYELGFMGKSWDASGIAFRVDVWSECMRVLKPGGHLLAFSGSRTYHRMAVAIEDAGFEIRDMLEWIYSTGFPKSMSIAKQLEKIPVEDTPDWVECHEDREKWLDQYRGLGTALKPAHEPICMARKPLGGRTVAANVLQHGTGALNIDGCRVGTDVVSTHSRGSNGAFPKRPGETSAEESGRKKDQREGLDHSERTGRWPANLIHDGSDEVVALFPNSAGAGGSVPNVKVTGYGDGTGTGRSEYLGGERTKVDSGSGSAARFFKQISNQEDLWEGVELPPLDASIAGKNSSQQRQAAVSALVLAANSALPEGLYCSDLYLEPSTSATESELRLIESSVTQTIQSIGLKFWHESEPARLSLSFNRASAVAIQRLTDTTTITVSHWKSDGSADPVTFSIMRQSLEAGERVYEPSTASRFMYCAKASKRDRDEGLEHMEAVHRPNGNKWTDTDYRVLNGERSEGREAGPRKNIHPTVKPTDLMAYLVRLVTPPGGVVLDPFLGSGSTGKAAIREGFRFIGCELSPEYLEIAAARIRHAWQQANPEPAQAPEPAEGGEQLALFA